MYGTIRMCVYLRVSERERKNQRLSQRPFWLSLSFSSFSSFRLPLSRRRLSINQPPIHTKRKETKENVVFRKLDRS